MQDLQRYLSPKIKEILLLIKVKKFSFEKFLITNLIEQAPPPGAYTVKNYDIGIKVIREEEEAKIFGLKRVPFGAVKSRFNDTAKDQGKILL